MYGPWTFLPACRVVQKKCHAAHISHPSGVYVRGHVCGVARVTVARESRVESSRAEHAQRRRSAVPTAVGGLRAPAHGTCGARKRPARAGGSGGGGRMATSSKDSIRYWAG